MSPVSLRLASETAGNDKTGVKLRDTPIDDFLKVLKRRRICLKEEEKSTEKSEKVSDDEDCSYEISTKENVLMKVSVVDDDDDPSYKESSKDEENETISEDVTSSYEEKTNTSSDLDSNEKSTEKSEKVSDDEDCSYKESSDENETDSEDDDDPSYGKRKKKSLSLKTNKNLRTQKKKATTVLSTYEKMIEEKKAERLAFLESLKINEFKADFTESVNAIKAKSKPVKRPLIKKVYSPRSPIPTRSSKRLANMNNGQTFSEDSLYEAEVKNAESEKMKSIPSKLTFNDALNSLYEQKYQSYVEDINIQMKYSTEKHLSYGRSVLQNLTLKGDNIFKIVPERITSMSWYPSADRLILAAGSKFGNIGILNLESKSLPYIFKIHNEGITYLQFNPFNSVHLLSSSYEGVIRHGDMIKQEFTEIYNVADEAGCTYFDFLSPTTYLVALNNGDITILDQRRGLRTTDKRHTCHSKSIKTVSIHPVNKNLFVTAENKGSVRLWDLRKLQKYPVVDINEHSRCVNSAFFSPITGNSLLTTSFDDSIRIFDSTNLTSDIRLTKRIRHNNNTGRWLSIFRASWLPHSDDLFVVGNVDNHPRTIQVFDKNMNICHLLKSPDLTTITSINVFHPFKPALAGGNSSGKVFVFL